MAGKQAKILSDEHIQDLLAYAHATRYPIRNELIVLLSVKAGLRAGEIANLTWNMCLTRAATLARPLSCMTMRQRKEAAGVFQCTRTCGIA